MSTGLLVWKQGSAQAELGKKIMWFDHQISPGPSDNRIKIAGFKVLPDSDGNFTSQNYTEAEGDAIHTFAIARFVLQIFENELNRRIYWSWEGNGQDQPLTIFIRNNDINARYLKEARCIELDYFGPYQNWTYYCRSVDIIAHEMGHAILDGLKPDWESSDIETRGMSEAFCDLAAMFFIASQQDLLTDFLKQTNGNFYKENILSQFGYGYGLDSNKPAAIRSAINSNKYVHQIQIAYGYSEVLVGSLYDLLIEMVKSRSAIEGLSANLICGIAAHWKSGIIRSFISCNEKKSNLKEFRKLLMSVMPNEATLIRQIFDGRHIPD